jgi:hypothetical protein
MQIESRKFYTNFERTQEAQFKGKNGVVHRNESTLLTNPIRKY